MAPVVYVRPSSPWTNRNRNPPLVSDTIQSSTTSEQYQNSDKETNYSDSSPFPPLPARPSKLDNLQISASSLLHLSFNQNHACFTAATDQGFGLYNCEPFSKRDFVPVHGIGIVEVFPGCDIFALVGGEPTGVRIWDNFRKKIIRNWSVRPEEVRAVRSRRDGIVVVMEQMIYVYNLCNWTTLHQFDTVENPKGLCAVSQVSGLFVLASPGLEKGQIRIEHYTMRRTKFIEAHSSEIACLALSQDGKLLATASTKGTLVRIFNSLSGSLLQEVRRGVDKAEIYSIAFSPTSQWLAVSSDKGTVHVFAVRLDNDKMQSASDINGNASFSGSSLSFMKGVLPRYFSSEWSAAQFRLHENVKYIVRFGQEKNTVIIVGMDGSFYKSQFDPVTGGEMVQLQFFNFLSLKKTF